MHGQRFVQRRRKERKSATGKIPTKRLSGERRGCEESVTIREVVEDGEIEIECPNEGNEQSNHWSAPVRSIGRGREREDEQSSRKDQSSSARSVESCFRSSSREVLSVEFLLIKITAKSNDRSERDRQEDQSDFPWMAQRQIQNSCKDQRRRTLREVEFGEDDTDRLEREVEDTPDERRVDRKYKYYRLRREKILSKVYQQLNKPSVQRGDSQRGRVTEIRIIVAYDVLSESLRH